LLLSLVFLFEFYWPHATKSEQGKPEMIGTDCYVTADKTWTWLDIIRKSNASVMRSHPIVPGDVPIYSEIVHPSVSNRSRSTSSLFYNRVSKTGSTTMLRLLGKMKKRNGFKTKNGGTNSRVVNSLEEEYVTKAMLQDNLLYHRHIYFIDFLRHGLQVDMMNMIRHPVSRILSWFYYSRSKSRWKGKKRKPPKSWFNKTLDQCVESNDPECQIGSCFQEMQLTYFCGFHPICRDPDNREALQIAKYNIENHYAVVGVLEELKISLETLQHYLPRWFDGVVSIPSKKMNKNKHPQISPENAKELEKRLHLDMELYDFVKKRLSLQHARLRSRN